MKQSKFGLFWKYFIHKVKVERRPFFTSNPTISLNGLYLVDNLTSRYKETVVSDLKIVIDNNWERSGDIHTLQFFLEEFFNDLKIH